MLSQRILLFTLCVSAEVSQQLSINGSIEITCLCWMNHLLSLPSPWKKMIQLLTFHVDKRLVLQRLGIIMEKAMAPHSSTLAWKIHGRKSLVGCSPWGHEESDTTERLHFHFSLSCIGEGNGNPLQYSCLENLRDGGAWWADFYGLARSRTRLRRLSSSSRNHHQLNKPCKL